MKLQNLLVFFSEIILILNNNKHNIFKCSDVNVSDVILNKNYGLAILPYKNLYIFL